MKRFSVCIFLLFFTAFLSGLPEYPLIRSLDFRDPLFVQLEEDIAAYHRAEAQGVPGPPLLFFRHTLTEDRDLLSLASRCSLPYDTLATLNGFTRNRLIHKGEQILVPNVPGIFLPHNPRNDMDRFSGSVPREGGFPCKPFGKQEFLFFAGERFQQVERAFFLGVFLGFPLREAVVSSYYGRRIDPFSGHDSFHHGIDLAAPLGSGVLAARGGKVTDLGYDPVYGHYLIIEHTNGYQTLYGHLKKSFVRLNQEVVLGMILGEVGVSGQTTGPHLHFEVRRNGVTRDPSDFIR